MTLVNTKRALDFFEARMEFTTGPIELNDMMERNEDINIIDVRLPEDYANEHIPGAFNAPRESWNTFSGLSRDKTNIIYCYSQVCHLAAAAARYFAEHDYPVMELEGGFEEWRRHNLLTES